MSGTVKLPDWMIERARAEAAKAPELIPGSVQWNALAAIIAGIPERPARPAIANAS